MKAKRFFLLLVCCLVTMAAAAQSDFAIGSLFEKYRKAKGCKVVEMHRAKVSGYQLDVYKSLTYKTLGPVVDQTLKTDRKRAKKIREVVEEGTVVTGYYMMPPENGVNRYILFSRTSEWAGALIYIEGKLSPDDIIALIYR